MRRRAHRAARAARCPCRIARRRFSRQRPADPPFPSRHSHSGAMPRIPTSPRRLTPWSSPSIATTLSPRLPQGGRRGARAAASTIVLVLSATLTGWALVRGAAPGMVAGMPPNVARVRLEGLAPPYFLPVGRTARLAVGAWSADGGVVRTAPRWRVDDAANATIDATSGVVTARRRGFVRVGATIGDTTAWWTLTIAPPADTVELQISRR